MDQSSNPLPHDTGDRSLINSQECLTGVDRLRTVRFFVRATVLVLTTGAILLAFFVWTTEGAGVQMPKPSLPT